MMQNVHVCLCVLKIHDLCCVLECLCMVVQMSSHIGVYAFKGLLLNSLWTKCPRSLLNIIQFVL